MSNEERIWSAIILSCALIGVFLYARSNLGYLGVWWDETAQFWISQGIEHYAEPWAPAGNIVAVLKLNRFQNLDPGGFTILEHYWSGISREIEWIRSLPFLFMLALLVCMGMLAWRLTRSWGFAVVGSTLPLAYPGVLYFAMENRAYSMEMAGVACGLFLLVDALDKRSYPAYLLLGIACALFMSSRYSYLFFVIAVYCTLLFCKPVGREGESARWLKQIAVFSLPVAAVGLVIYRYMLSYQLWPEMTDASYLHIAAPIYTRSSVLADSGDYLQLLFTNFLSLPAIPISLCIVYFLFVQSRAYRFVMSKNPNARFDYKLTTLYVFILAYQGVSLAMSFLGLYPWDINARWNAYLLIVSAVASILLLAEARILWGQVRAVVKPPGGLRVLRLWITAVGAAGYIYFTAVHAATFRLTESAPWTDLTVQIDQFHRLADRTGKLFVTRYDTPALRYLYEFGPLRGSAEYPDAFRFETDAEWRSQEAIDVSNGETRFIVSAIPMTELQSRFPRNELRPAGPGAKPLLLITDQDPDTE